MILRVKLTPNASLDEVIGWTEDPLIGKHLRIRIKAPPVEGKANQALIRFLSKHLDVPKSQIRLKKGTTSRFKSVSLPDSAKLKLLEEK